MVISTGSEGALVIWINERTRNWEIEQMFAGFDLWAFQLLAYAQVVPGS